MLTRGNKDRTAVHNESYEVLFSYKQKLTYQMTAIKIDLDLDPVFSPSEVSVDAVRASFFCTTLGMKRTDSLSRDRVSKPSECCLHRILV